MKLLIFILVVVIAIMAVSIFAKSREKRTVSNENIISTETTMSTEADPERVNESSVDENEEIVSNEYLSVYPNGYGDVTVYFEIESDIPFAIGEKMEEINENAYMNGYAWDGLLRYVMSQRCPELLETIQTDCEAGTYVAYFPESKSGVENAKKLGNLIISLIENEEELYRIVREHGDEIEWDHSE